MTYVGSFVLADTPYRYEKVHDLDGRLRRVIVFNLLPIEADLTPVPYIGDIPAAARFVDWVQMNDSDYSVGQIELAPSYAKREEFSLQNRFASWRREQGHDLKRLELPVGRTVLVPDFYDATAAEIIEAKKSPARGFIRLAIGQSLDYVNNAHKFGIEATPSILIPGKPEPDLVDLCAVHKIGLWVPDGEQFGNLVA